MITITQVITIILFYAIYIFLNYPFYEKNKNNNKFKLNEKHNCSKLIPICLNNMCYHKCIKYVKNKKIEIYIWNKNE